MLVVAIPALVGCPPAADLLAEIKLLVNPPPPGGSLDESFGNGGIATIPIGSGNDGGSSAAVQSDGKILVAGDSFNGTNEDFAIVRYNSNGSLDTGFGSGGKVTTQIGSSDDGGSSAAVQSDGKILVAGDSFNGTNYDFAIVRYWP